MEAVKYLRTPLKIEQILMIDKYILDDYALYVEKDTERFNENIIVYLDNNLDVDEEIYPVFACNLDLQWFFSGQIVSDIITNTQFQLKNSTVADYMRNLNFYSENDCFYHFDYES